MENHELKILELVKSGKIKEGDLANLDIYHDDDCPRLLGTGGCNCNPDITVHKAENLHDWVDHMLQSLRDSRQALRDSRRKH